MSAPQTPVDPGAPPSASRIFIGYRATSLSRQPGDSDAIAQQKRTQFFAELGSTFMPGTPLMQAPIGLSAYVPAVIDPPEGSNLPDEVAAIIYASRPVYDYFRSNSLSRRMYTHSHTAVFDMQRSVAQFPAPLNAPATTAGVDGEHEYTCLNPERIVDWQFGAARVLFITPQIPSIDFKRSVMSAVAAMAGHAEIVKVDQVLVTACDRFAAVWLHGPQAFELPADQYGLVPPGSQLLRDLPAQPASVVGDSERGISISGPAAFSFRFERRLELFR